jgi:hypothetical protein
MPALLIVGCTENIGFIVTDAVSKTARHKKKSYPMIG